MVSSLSVAAALVLAAQRASAYSFPNVTYTTDSGDTIVNNPDGTSYTYNNGDIAWVLTSTALVWLMIPGVG